MPPLVLVIDDDPDVREFERLTLSRKYDVIVAPDGLAGWKLFEEREPALVVTDLCMPGMNGIDLAEKIRAHPTRGATPVVIVTGATVGEELPGGFWRMGTAADGFLEKPLDPAVLLAEVHAQFVRLVKPKAAPKGKGFY